MARPRIVPFEDKNGKWRWRLYGGNGEPMATSQAYEGNRANAVRGAEDARQAFAIAEYAPMGLVDVVDEELTPEEFDDEPPDPALDIAAREAVIPIIIRGSVENAPQYVDPEDFE